jgi:ABC-type glutathione transport system ATPase component
MSDPKTAGRPVGDLLAVEHLGVDYPVRGRGPAGGRGPIRGKWPARRKEPVRALRDVSLTIRPGECLGLVGESGSGKTTLGRAILGLVRPSSGRIVFDGQDITSLSKDRRRALSSEIQVVFQDPYSSLNPARPVAAILAEPLEVAGASRAEARERIRQVLDDVGLPPDAADRLPRAFSGGQRQRIAIARALVRRPRLVVCDEPVSALDLSTQARVLDLLVDVQRRTGVAYLFISHDLDVIRHVSHRAAVLRHGEIVESGPADDVTRRPHHAYTKRLMLSSPVADPDRQARRRAERRAAAEAA